MRGSAWQRDESWRAIRFRYWLRSAGRSGALGNRIDGHTLRGGYQSPETWPAHSKKVECGEVLNGPLSAFFVNDLHYIRCDTNDFSGSGLQKLSGLFSSRYVMGLRGHPYKVPKVLGHHRGRKW